MKEYTRLVLWLDYFNSSISRSEGRRVPLDRAVKTPSLDELVEAAKRAGYTPEPQIAAHPKRSSTVSGYVSVERTKPKSLVIKEVASSLRTLKAERKQVSN